MHNWWEQPPPVRSSESPLTRTASAHLHVFLALLLPRQLKQNHCSMGRQVTA
jgi:hypothetical protein